MKSSEFVNTTRNRNHMDLMTPHDEVSKQNICSEVPLISVEQHNSCSLTKLGNHSVLYSMDFILLALSTASQNFQNKC